MMVGNLAFAGMLSSEDFGRLTLFQAVLFIGVGLAPLGLDSLVVRREIEAVRTAMVGASVAAIVTAILIVVAAKALYDFGTWSIALIAVACLVGAVARIYAAFEQAVVRLPRSQLISQAPHLCYGLAALLLLAGDWRDWRVAALVLVAGYVVSAGIGWVMFRSGTRRFSPGSGRSIQTFSREMWRRAFTFAGILASLLLLSQVERLVVARFSTLEDLATFGVAVAIVGSPYRLLGSGIGYALMPRLRQEASAAGRRRLLRAELYLALILGGGGGGVLIVAARPLIESLYGGKYDVTVGLIVAIVLVGFVRLLYGCASAAVSALGETPQLRSFNVLGWVGTLVAVVSAVALSSYGLVGVVAGAGLGWLVRLAAATVLVGPAFMDDVRL